MRRTLTSYLIQIIAVCVITVPSNAQELSTESGDDSALVSKLKTAYLYNIAKFVNWRDSSNEVVLCLNENSPLYPFAKNLAGKQVSGDRTLTIASGVSASCHIVFNDQSSHNETRLNIVANSWPPNTLAITDHSNARAQGYAIRLYTADGRLRFSINADALAGTEYQISSKLLRLARDEFPNQS